MCAPARITSRPCASVSELPAPLRRPQKKHAPGISEHVSCGFSRFSSILGSPKWHRHMTPTTHDAQHTTSQQPPHPAATSKHPAQGSNVLFRGNPLTLMMSHGRILNSTKMQSRSRCPHLLFVHAPERERESESHGGK